MKIIKVKALHVRQKEFDFYTFQIRAKTLLQIAYFNTRELDREEGIQRPLQQKRSYLISQFLESDEAILPNNIIVNIRAKELLNLENLEYKDGYLTIPMVKNLAFIIDGQHRIRAFDYLKDHPDLDDFPLVVSCFTNLSLSKVAEIFVNINYYQKPVSKSLVFDLLGISKNAFPEYYPHHILTQKLNETLQSPWHDEIKMLGIGKGIISQASFITAMEDNGVMKKLKEFSIDDKYLLLVAYFNAIKDMYKSSWCNSNYILCKSVGINSQMMLLSNLLTRIKNLDKLKKMKDNTLKNYFLRRLKKLDNTIDFNDKNIKNLGGKKGATQLFALMSEKLGWKNEK